jgi:hypothetical protein
VLKCWLGATGACWTADENSSEISSRIDPEYLQHAAAFLTKWSMGPASSASAGEQSRRERNKPGDLG